jgi:hypothetical protein
MIAPEGADHRKSLGETAHRFAAQGRYASGCH